MNRILFSMLDAYMGQELTHTMALDILKASSMLDELVRREDIERIAPKCYGEFVFAVERMESIEGEIRPLHVAHWNETESHRHGIEFNPDYETFFKYERAGRAVLFTLRKDGELLGNFSLYLDRSMHTQTLLATEDTLFIMPSARKGRTAMRFIEYAEQALRMIGVKEISVSVKNVNKAGRFFQMIGYRHVENGLTKVLETKNVRTETAQA